MYDSDDRRKLHKSHDWKLAGGRWMACSRCETRGYWPGASRPCKLKKVDRAIISHREAHKLLKKDLTAFFEWWLARGEPSELPSLDEWAANYFEWRKSVL